MRIPDVRDELRRLADELDCQRLNELADELYRRPYVRRSSPRARSASALTAAELEEIRVMVRDNPNMPYREIGRRFNLDGGRISEIVAGFRD